MPVDPGNLLLTAELDGKPVLGLPGCAKSPKYNGFDMVLERLAAGLPVGRAEIVRMGAGGLLAEIPSRPQPRDDDATEGEGPQQAPRVAVLVLAAGRSTRMGGPNKMLADANGQPLVVHAVKAALASQAVEVVVVLGHMADEVRAAIEKAVPAKSRLRFVTNPDFAEGLSTSVRTGIGALGTNIDAAIVQLGDMPGRQCRAARPPDGGLQPRRGPLDLRADGRRQARQSRAVGAPLLRRRWPSSPATPAPST